MVILTVERVASTTGARSPRRIWEVAVHSFHQPGGKAPGGRWEDVESPQLPEKPSSKVLEEISKINRSNLDCFWSLELEFQIPIYTYNEKSHRLSVNCHSLQHVSTVSVPDIIRHLLGP